MFDLSSTGALDVLLDGLWTDVLWGVCLGMMTVLSLRTWRQVHREAWVPLQWGRDGEPVMRAQRDLAVAFTPMAAVVAGLLLAASQRLSGAIEPGWTVVRLFAPILLVVAHRSHMGHALETLKLEGGLRG
jgi:hypothetical protein